MGAKQFRTRVRKKNFWSWSKKGGMRKGGWVRNGAKRWVRSGFAPGCEKNFSGASRPHPPLKNPVYAPEVYWFWINSKWHVLFHFDALSTFNHSFICTLYKLYSSLRRWIGINLRTCCRYANCPSWWPFFKTYLIFSLESSETEIICNQHLLVDNLHKKL